MLAILLAVGLGMSARLSACLAPLTEQVARAGELARVNSDTGEQLLEEAWKTWQNCRDFAAAVLDHSPMEEIDGMFAAARTYGLTGIGEAMAAECSRLVEWIQAMAESQKLTWQNLL